MTDGNKVLNQMNTDIEKVKMMDEDSREKFLNMINEIKKGNYANALNGSIKGVEDDLKTVYNYMLGLVDKLKKTNKKTNPIPPSMTGGKKHSGLLEQSIKVLSDKDSSSDDDLFKSLSEKSSSDSSLDMSLSSSSSTSLVDSDTLSSSDSDDYGINTEDVTINDSEYISEMFDMSKKKHKKHKKVGSFHKTSSEFYHSE